MHNQIEKAQYRGETKRESATAYFDTKAIKIHGNCSKMKMRNIKNGQILLITIKMKNQNHQNEKPKPSN